MNRAASVMNFIIFKNSRYASYSSLILVITLYSFFVSCLLCTLRLALVHNKKKINLVHVVGVVPTSLY